MAIQGEVGAASTPSYMSEGGSIHSGRSFATHARMVWALATIGCACESNSVSMGSSASSRGRREQNSWLPIQI